MEAFCKAAPSTPKLANMLEGGSTPILPPTQLEAMGFKIAAYPLTLMSTAVGAMNRALADLKAGREVEGLLDFAELRDVVGFNEYYDGELLLPTTFSNVVPTVHLYRRSADPDGHGHCHLR